MYASPLQRSTTDERAPAKTPLDFPGSIQYIVFIPYIERETTAIPVKISHSFSSFKSKQCEQPFTWSRSIHPSKRLMKLGIEYATKPYLSSLGRRRGKHNIDQDTMLSKRVNGC
eukprot:m.12669 g.12669  ORF g.12669 m.12669 type:complete len:114 (+) comp4038_c0_seq1:222-563(+)